MTHRNVIVVLAVSFAAAASPGAPAAAELIVPASTAYIAPDVRGQFFLSHGRFVSGSTKYGKEFTRPGTRKAPSGIVLPTISDVPPLKK